eukprot:GFKZ01008611.1.p1 GENE.GFKZ01008611.1~~GFKZ01008611.1.p1  ORF type:complete len:186 (+),score=19.52 GFKZ01008611.1:186-743(+)
MTTAFIIPCLPRPHPRGTVQPQVACSLTPYSRRAALFFLAALPSTLTFPTLADRTGKYSTKLTAKRRYLPRIERGINALGSLNLDGETWRVDTGKFADEVAPDMRTAMELFATTYFSEGNRIGVTERELAECVDEIFGAVARMKRLAELGNLEDVKDAVRAASKGCNRYVQVARLEDKIALISVA